MGDVEGGGGDGGALEDVLWGSVMGFFGRLARLHGWLERKEFGVDGGVIVGVSINLAVCALRGLG